MSAQVTNWRKSTRSNNGQACVEVGSTSSIVAIRDTKDRSAGTFVVSHSDWKAFIATVISE